MKLDEEYPEVWNIAGDKKIPKSKLAEALFKLLWKILKEVKAGKRDELDIGNVGGIFLFSLDVVAPVKERHPPEIYYFLEGLSKNRVIMLPV